MLGVCADCVDDDEVRMSGDDDAISPRPQESEQHTRKRGGLKITCRKAGLYRRGRGGRAGRGEWIRPRFCSSARVLRSPRQTISRTHSSWPSLLISLLIGFNLAAASCKCSLRQKSWGPGSAPAGDQGGAPILPFRNASSSPWGGLPLCWISPVKARDADGMMQVQHLDLDFSVRGVPMSSRLGARRTLGN